MFKTKGVKLANDTLTRNFQDVYIWTGMFWFVAVNAYLASDLNAAKDVMTDENKSIIRQTLWL